MIERLPRILLRLEGLALAAGAVVLYLDADYGVVWLVVLLLAPDLSAVGYLAGVRVGAACYDVAHTSVWPLALGVFGLLAESGVSVQLALIWLLHIGVDRALGFGLKYPTRFRDTHLQRV